LDLDDGFGAVELRAQLLDLVTQLGIFEREWIGLDAALFRREAIQDSLSALTTPGIQVRRIQPFAADQRTALR
jgi:hypothetical protein